MVVYTKDENQKDNYKNNVLLDMYNDSGEILRIIDSNFIYQNLITRNENLDLYNAKPLIEDVESNNKLHSLKILDTPKQKANDQGMNWNEYHNLDVIYAWMESLEYNYPSLCSVIPIGITIEGRTMKILKISNSDVQNEPVWIDAGIHGREWIAPAVNTFIANYIVLNFKSLPSCFTNKDWYFLPVANPDGYDYSHKVDRMWRKSRAAYGGEITGVDLNRNFSFGWGGRHSSTDPSSAFFRGREPFSEPESTAMKDILMNSGIKFKVYVTLHSFGQVIVFPFGYRDELCPDYMRLLQGATAMSKAIFRSTGNVYKVGISRDVMYGASGTSTDWSYGAAKIPYCYLIELRSKEHKFELPKEEIKENCKEVLHCIHALMDFVDKNPVDNENTNLSPVPS
ncbi:PREDICTED: carboxypeptidase B-like [Papilio xuthus]|uniref:Carboxypeptidase B-like n=1 Tax=Papilio xuthus TaxID=66420 RepID=A0AAJ6ZW88_PAPXU|nr:PREDICTED: carboxypeptidase B-like [Papilio xuthus]